MRFKHASDRAWLLATALLVVVWMLSMQVAGLL
jgi:hypothetical protein